MTVHFLNTKPLREEILMHQFDLSILERISVTAPYFALKNLQVDFNDVYCSFTTELINIAELGPISGAEVGRHMAILGSVVLARQNPRNARHYYLATDALIKRCIFKPSSNNQLFARARMVELNRKKGLVTGEILDQEGNVLYEVEVTYMVLVESIFERMFANHRIETITDTTVNPYTEDSNFYDLKLDVQACYATIGQVVPENCPGHFNNFPALPVARMGTSMGKLGGMHFMHLNPSEKKKYYIAHAELHAKQLVFVGENVKFRTEIVDPKAEKGMVIRTVAYTDECDFIAETICNFHY